MSSVSYNKFDNKGSPLTLHAKVSSLICVINALALKLILEFSVAYKNERAGLKFYVFYYLFKHTLGTTPFKELSESYLMNIDQR